MLFKFLFLVPPALMLGQLESTTMERLLDYGGIGLLCVTGFGLLWRSEKRNDKLEAEKAAMQTKHDAEKAALQDRLEKAAKEYAADLRTLAVNANTSNDRTADALEATGKSLDVIAVEYRRSNDARGLPR